MSAMHQQERYEDIRKRRYTNVIALNNHGVQLLEKECYRQALETFDAALSLMQPPPGIDLTSGEELVAQCALRSMNLKPDAGTLLLLEILTWKADGTLVQCNNEASVLQTVLVSAPSSSVAFPIRLEAPCAVHQALLTHQGAIISHNQGIAYLCLIQDNASREQFCNTASCYAQMACSALMQVPVLDSVEWYCLTITALNSYILSLQESNLHEQAAEFYALLVQMRDDACVFEVADAQRHAYHGYDTATAREPAFIA